MNILYFLDKFPKLSESFVINEIKKLEELGHNVFIFALEDPSENVKHLEYYDIDAKIAYKEDFELNRFETFSMEKLSSKIWKSDYLDITQERHDYMLKLALYCIEFIESNNADIDLVQTHFANRRRYPSTYVSNYFDVPLSTTVHAFDLYKNPKEEILYKILVNSDLIITISNYNKRFIQEKYPKIQPKVVRLGIDTDKFSESCEKDINRILTVSRLVEKKGVDTALETVSILSERGNELDYRIVGSGKLEKDLKNKAKSLGIEDAVNFVGNVSDEELMEEYDKASCFLLPCKVASDGNKDGIPVALMEAMSMKTLPITTHVSGIPELVDDGQNGFLVEPESPEKMANKLEKILNHESNISNMANQARKKIKKDFNLETQVKLLEEKFQETIQEFN